MNLLQRIIGNVVKFVGESFVGEAEEREEGGRERKKLRSMAKAGFNETSPPKWDTHAQRRRILAGRSPLSLTTFGAAARNLRMPGSAARWILRGRASHVVAPTRFRPDQWDAREWSEPLGRRPCGPWRSLVTTLAGRAISGKPTPGP